MTPKQPPLVRGLEPFKLGDLDKSPSPKKDIPFSYQWKVLPSDTLDPEPPAIDVHQAMNMRPCTTKHVAYGSAAILTSLILPLVAGAAFSSKANRVTGLAYGLLGSAGFSSATATALGLYASLNCSDTPASRLTNFIERKTGYLLR